MDNEDFDWFDMEENDFMQECESADFLEVEEYMTERGGKE